MFRLFPHLRDVSSFIRSLFLRGSPLFISRLSSGIIFRDLILNLDKSLKNQLQKQKSFLFDKLSDDPIATFLLLSSRSLLKAPYFKILSFVNITDKWYHRNTSKWWTHCWSIFIFYWFYTSLDISVLQPYAMIRGAWSWCQPLLIFLLFWMIAVYI